MPNMFKIVKFIFITFLYKKRKKNPKKNIFDIFHIIL